MRRIVTGIYYTILSTLGRIYQRIISDSSVDIRDLINWILNGGLKVVILTTEKWLGFWYGFLKVFIIGLVGYTFLELASLMSANIVFTDPIRLIYGIILIGGTYVILLWGMMVFTLVIVSGIRVVYWVQEGLEKYWRENTPPYRTSKRESHIRQWPPSDDSKNKARKRSWYFFQKGAIWFPLLIMTLILIEFQFSEKLSLIISEPILSSIGEALSASIWLIDVNQLYTIAGPSLSPFTFITSLIVFGIPSVFMALAMRNLLFLTEAEIRIHIEKATNGSQFEWRWLWLLLLNGLCFGYAAGLGYSFLSGI